MRVVREKTNQNGERAGVGSQNKDLLHTKNKRSFKKYRHHTLRNPSIAGAGDCPSPIGCAATQPGFNSAFRLQPWREAGGEVHKLLQRPDIAAQRGFQPETDPFMLLSKTYLHASTAPEISNLLFALASSSNCSGANSSNFSTALFGMRLASATASVLDLVISRRCA
jgi:hypothetical protein